MTSSTARPRPVVAALILVALIATAALIGPARVDAAPPSVDPVIAAQFGARWAAARVNASGFVPGPTNAPNVSATIETALALQQAGVEMATFNSIVTWLQANVGLAINPAGTTDSAGNLGELLLISTAAGISPTNFGGQNLKSRLSATLGLFAPGLYGASDPTYDGAFRQSLALLGLQAAGGPVPPAAVTWLATQQCDATTPTAAGGWQPYRASLSVPCDAPNSTTFAGPDTNSSAMALQALVGVAGLGNVARTSALNFLAAAQSPDGGFPFIPGGTVDPNSTSLVILGVIAGGENPTLGRWSLSGGNPYTSLLSWQLGCAAAAGDRGAFTSPFSGGAPDDFANRQAVWGASGKLFFAIQPVAFKVAPVPCVAPATTTTTTSATSPTSTTTSALPDPAAVEATVAAQPASVVVASPSFAG